MVPRPDHANTVAGELRRIFSLLKRRLRDQDSGSDLNSTQKAVLLRLEKDGPAAVSTLARAEGMRPQSMSAVILALQNVGLVKGTPDPGDGRQTLISLTRKCSLWLKSSRAARQDWLAATIRKELTRAEQAQLAAAIVLLERLANR